MGGERVTLTQAMGAVFAWRVLLLWVSHTYQLQPSGVWFSKDFAPDIVEGLSVHS